MTKYYISATPADRARFLASAYVDTINGPANGWGQHVHPSLGRSDHIMLSLRQLVGDAECNRLLDAAEAARKDQS